MGVRKVMRAGHRQGGGVGGCSLGVVCEMDIVGSECSECRRAYTHTYTHTFTPVEYPLGKRRSQFQMFFFGQFWAGEHRPNLDFGIFSFQARDPNEALQKGGWSILGRTPEIESSKLERTR